MAHFLYLAPSLHILSIQDSSQLKDVWWALLGKRDVQVPVIHTYIRLSLVHHRSEDSVLMLSIREETKMERLGESNRSFVQYGS